MVTERGARLHHEEEVMGTVVTFDAYFDDEVPTAAYDAVILAARELHRIDEIFSTYKMNSPLSQLRRGEAALSSMAPEVHEVLHYCRRARRASKGWFDPWSVAGGVDPTGLVKGWAGSRALTIMNEAGVKDVIVNAAGDIASSGTYYGAAYRVGIADPHNKHALYGVVELRGALATSGTYERGEHLYNPFSKRYVTKVASGSVKGADLAVCDALASALCLGGDEVFELITQGGGVDALMIRHDGSYLASEGMGFTVM
jgi:thiamine biosynthesis lipoprotein